MTSRREVSAPAVYTGLLGALFVNGVLQEIVAYTHANGFWEGVWNTFGLSAVLFLAIGCAVHLLMSAPSRALGCVDRLVIPAVLLLLCLPVSQLSWVAMTLASSRLVLSRGACQSMRAAGAIGLALATAAFWGRLVLHIFSQGLLGLDALIIATVLRLEISDNLIRVSDDFSILILQDCSSLRGISLALLCWIAISRSLQPAFHRRDLWAAALVTICALIVNLGRLSVMAHSRDWFAIAHSPTGGAAATALLLLAAATIAFLGNRRDTTPLDR